MLSPYDKTIHNVNRAMLPSIVLGNPDAKVAELDVRVAATRLGRPDVDEAVGGSLSKQCRIVGGQVVKEV